MMPPNYHASMTTDHLQPVNEEIREVWNKNAAFWDERMGDGNEFVEILVWPSTERLLDLRSGERVLDIACGSGLSSRRLAATGAEVVAFDFAEDMMRRMKLHFWPRVSAGSTRRFATWRCSTWQSWRHSCDRWRNCSGPAGALSFRSCIRALTVRSRRW
jgi:2-polyprenyl-3-methyl-5-hydroxy-6-metoxy-1,4-benzoquinol methylase